MKLKDQVFIITGATSGMGRAIAIKFAKEGAKMILGGRNEERGMFLLNEITGLGAKAFFLSGDVAEESYNQNLVKTALEKFGKIDGISINAGTLGLGALTELPSESWHRTFAVNVDAAFYLLKAGLPELKKSNKANVLINGSIAAFKNFPNHPAYCASKAALVALAKQTAVDYAPEVRVNCICPGPVDTPFIHASAVAFPDPEKAVEDAGKNTPLQRLGRPEDVANLALFLASEDASWITGAVYTIDGGAMVKS
ncbi:3-oxoacyl-[acyl-carrier protein] reductase [Indibacter alkaliphilus LW1]|uniref:3-oxoacyl-[acyl-carrier protein] reductase n=1 Tax=Indibacter alkaliphilus (strain CCUG 57479 / KCTC 22604 / LW1) TaxID=1189612 RepID=S2DX41_INDAL|nr:SDR family oxidoreductase [Indibacter alkaliphilus]EOZ96641.1 3-oxoacyl-[acyl-carrier protein] reductase [Indibacter alkaliphilus LW1]